jgi:hypothetical protein
MANTNSAKNYGQKGDLKAEGHPALTFAEIPGAQEVDTNHEKDHNRDVDGKVIELISDDQLLFMGNQLLRSHNSRRYPSM